MLWIFDFLVLSVFFFRHHQPCLSIPKQPTGGVKPCKLFIVRIQNEIVPHTPAPSNLCKESQHGLQFESTSREILGR